MSQQEKPAESASSQPADASVDVDPESLETPSDAPPSLPADAADDSDSDDSDGDGKAAAGETPERRDSKAESQDDDTDDAGDTQKFTSVRDLGACSEKNARFRRTMEDEHVHIDAFLGKPDVGYYAVYDGHGGRAAVEFVAKNLHENLQKIISEGKKPGEALKEAYMQTDQGVSDALIQFSGTTSISVLIHPNDEGKRTLYSANAGDARTVLSRNGVAERLTFDHKGSDPAEIKRITDAGGFVVHSRVNGILAVTRSLGDVTMKDYVTGEPYQTEYVLEDTDRHCILACDGLWDVCEDQDAVDLIKDIDSAQQAADTLMAYALKNGSMDNITIMVLHL
jgi:protein phosphatase PTC1